MTPRISFLGAANQVTGSCHLLDTGRHRLLLDCGLFQGGPELEAQNNQPFAFEPTHIDAVVLSHAHLDHAGRLPLLVKQGFKGPIYAHAATRDLCNIMLADAAHIQENDAATETRKLERRGLPAVVPLYTNEDVQRCLGHFRDLPYDERRELLPDVSCRLRDAGHILGAAIVEVWTTGGRKPRKLVFSGDLGHRGSFIMPPPKTVEDADLVIMESVYGDRTHRSDQATLQELSEIIHAAYSAGGDILIPAFAVGRTQELLFIFAQHARAWGLEDWRIFLDSPMAIHTTEVYATHAGLLNKEAALYAQLSHFTAPNLHFTPSVDQSMGINRVTSRAIIIAGSGMCNGGRIRHHLKHHLWREQDHVLFVGFQGIGTLGRRLVDGAREVRLWGEPINVAVQVHTLGGFSAHADQRGLIEWYGAFRARPPVALVHGEPSASTALAGELHRRFGCKVTIPKQGESLELAPAVPADARNDGHAAVP
jgi:metallo-beta-lactamase family protein